MAGVLLAQVTIAALYAWSILATALQNERGWSSDQTLFAYALAQFVFALSTLLSGRLVDQKGPRPSLVIGGILYGGGLMLSSLATTPAALYLSYGVLAGAGVGFVYVCPLATLIQWFPHHKGMITGLSVGVFGAGSILFKEVISWLLVGADVSTAFLRLGMISMALILIGAIFTNRPEGVARKSSEKQPGDHTTREMIRTGKFYQIWFMYLLAVIPGLLVLGAAKTIGLEAGLDAGAAAGIITLLALANAGSRLISGTLSDRFGVLNVLRVVFVITIVSLLSLSFFAHVLPIFYIGVMGIAVGYGGFLALIPTLTNVEFGSHRYGSNYGVIFQAYGLAALLGILIKAVAGSFITTFLISAAASVLGLILAFSISERDRPAHTVPGRARRTTDPAEPDLLN